MTNVATSRGRKGLERQPIRLGAIYPDDAWVDVEAEAVVDEFRRFMPAGVELISAATPIPNVEASLIASVELAENGDIEEAARRLRRFRPAAYAYYCTTISFVRGPGGDREIAERITRATGLPAVTTSTAMIEALRSLGISRVAVASPYMPDVERRFVDFIQSHGIEVVNSRSLHLPDGHSIVLPEKMQRLAESADVPAAEAVFVGCTGQRLAELIEAMEARLGKPVLTANQVTSWMALQLLGVPPRLDGRGRLFSLGVGPANAR